MKRINQRLFDSDREETDFGNAGAEKPVINIDTSEEYLQSPRFGWVRQQVHDLGSRCILCYNLLDIGVDNAALAVTMAKKNCNPNDPSSPRIRVDGVEADAQAFKSASEAARQVRERGYVVNVFNTTFEEFHSDKKYDVVVAFEVLEHVKDPVFCIEKIYDMLEIGGHLFISVPEQDGIFGETDKNKYHMWTATAQSVVFRLFPEDQKWKIVQMFDVGGILHVMVRKLSHTRW